MKKSKRHLKKRVKRKTIRKYKGGGHDFYLLSSKLNGDKRRPIYKFHAQDSDNKGGNAIFFKGKIEEIISANDVANKEIEKYEPHTLPILRDTTKGIKDKFSDDTIYGLRRYGIFTTTYNSKSERENNKRENDKTKQIHEKLSKSCPNDVAILYDYGIKVYIKKIKVIGKSIKGQKNLGNVEASRCDEDNCFYNLMEYGNTVLEHYLIMRYYIGAKNLPQICIILLKKIQNIHNEKVLHLDIKPNNIIMIEHENGEFYDGIKRYNLKFIDFGYSEIVGEDYQHIDGFMGTPGYKYEGIDRYNGIDRKTKTEIYNRINDIYAIMQIFYNITPNNLEQDLNKKASFFHKKGIVDQCNKIDFVKNCSEYFFRIFSVLTYLITPFHQNIAITKEGINDRFSSLPILDDTKFNFSSNPYTIEKTEKAYGIKYLLEFVDFLKEFDFHITPIEDFSYENRLNLLIEILNIYFELYEYINELYDLFKQYCKEYKNQLSGTTMFQLLDVDDEREFHPNNPKEVLGFIQEIRSEV